MEKTFYIVGIKEQSTDLYYPVLSMVEHFFSSEYVHDIRMYADRNGYKLIVDPIDEKVFGDTPDGRYLHMLKAEGSSVFVKQFKKYLFEGKAWERWDVVPYLEFTRGENGEIVPVRWFDEAFKTYLGF